MSTADRAASLRNHRRKEKRKGRGLRRMSADDLSGSEEDHLARVSDLKSFFENLNKTDTTGKSDFIGGMCSPVDTRGSLLLSMHVAMVLPLYHCSCDQVSRGRSGTVGTQAVECV